MCRYGQSTYKEHFACFHCCKMFRQPNVADVINIREPAIQRQCPCPQCGNLMADLGKDFKAPPKQQIKQWQKIKLLYEQQITFHSCGCDGPGYRPATLQQTPAFITSQQSLSAGEQLLRRIQSSRKR